MGLGATLPNHIPACRSELYCTPRLPQVNPKIPPLQYQAQQASILLAQVGWGRFKVIIILGKKAENTINVF